MQELSATCLGRIQYGPAFELQKSLAERRARHEIGDTLLLLEHDPVYTLGRRATDAEVLLTESMLDARGIQVVRTDRGGLATYHGPGQLVGYPILDLGLNADVPAYVHSLEQALIDTAAAYGIEATRAEGQRGIWVGDDKLAAIGVHVARGITTHGFAMNVDCDLAAFNGIVPCGISDKGVTSIKALTGAEPGLQAVAPVAADALATQLRMTLAWTELAHA